MNVQQLTVLGSTGSIGVSTLDVVSRHRDRWAVFALTANSSVEQMFKQCQEFSPRYAVLRKESAAEELQRKLAAAGSAVTVLAGSSGLVEVASHTEVDCVMAAIVGAAGLESSLAAAKAGKKVLLANKESLVMSGNLFMQAVAESGAQLLPIDSEHNAIFQCMPPGYETGSKARAVEKILLTGSGGPFRQTPLDQLARVTPEQACKHPNWAMGAKISVDSATMMNKGLELIEALWLFNAQPEDVEIVIHPQSVIHSLVQYNDGSVLAQLGNPDMRTPIAHGLAWPERVDSGVEALNLVQIAQLTFEAPDFDRFPCLRLATEAARESGAASCVLNAANEVAVDAFLGGRLGYADISRVIADTLERTDKVELPSISDVVQLDAEARQTANECLAGIQA